MDNVDELYASFGREVRAEVLSELQTHGNLARLLRQLNLNVPSNPASQHEVLRGFLFQFGISFFLNAVRKKLTPEQVEQMKVRRLVEGTARRFHDGPRSSSAAGGRAAFRSRTAARSFLHGENQGSPDSPVAYVVTPAYSGPERRHVEERRMGPPTRRHEVELIMKNKRFGGRDRRKVLRRKRRRSAGTSRS